jgi:hypothetical protein
VAAGMVAVAVVVEMVVVVDRRLVGDLGGSVSSLRKVPPAKWALMLVLCTFLQFEFRCPQSAMVLQEVMASREIAGRLQQMDVYCDQA